jgi:hypothetical protein
MARRAGRGKHTFVCRFIDPRRAWTRTGVPSGSTSGSRPPAADPSTEIAGPPAEPGGLGVPAFGVPADLPDRAVSDSCETEFCCRHDCSERETCV